MDFRQKLMRKIYWIWFTRRVLPVAVFEVFSVILGVHLFSKSVFIVRIMQNAAAAAGGSKTRLFSFIWSAFWNTRIEVRIEMAIAVLFAALFLWSVKRAIVSYEVLRRSGPMVEGETKP